MLRRPLRRWYTRRLAHWNYRVRTHACLQLGVVGDEECLGVLIARLGDRDAEVREAACRALGMLGLPEAVASLLPRTTDRSTEVREAACLALGMLGDEGVALDLLRLVGSERSYTRRAAVEGLGYIRYAPAVPVLTRLLEKQEPLTHAFVVRALGRIGDESAVPAVAGVLRSSDRRARAEACRALGALRSIQGVDPLGGALDDPSREVRRAAAEALRGLTAALEPRVPGMLCGQHLTRFALRPVGRAAARRPLRVPVCRICGSAAHALTGLPVVTAVLDRAMEVDRERIALGLRVNALRRTEPFDFDEVLVVDVDEADLERFCIRVANDLDATRRVRYRSTRALVRPSARLSARARHVLSSVLQVEETGRDGPAP